MSEHALVFGAKQVASALFARHASIFPTEKIIKWAKGCALKHPATSNDPHWWLASAVNDIDCLDACLKMLREM